MDVVYSNMTMTTTTEDSTAAELLAAKMLRHRLSTASFYISYAGIAVALFAMGCVISIKDFSDKDTHMSKSVVVGIFFSSIFQPLIGYGLALLLQMDVFDALALIILACSPVSPFCAIFVYYGEGVVIVGLCLAMFSTALSIGLVPLWFSIYGNVWTTEYYVIAPPSDIALAELEIFIPTALGLMYKRLYGKKKAKLVAKVLSNAFWVAAIIGPLLIGIAYPEDFTVDWKIWIAAIVLPLIGFFCGLFLSLFFNLPFEVCGAISLAVGTPNWFIAKSLALRFFDDDDDTLRGVYGLLSIISITLPIEGFIWSIMFRSIQEFFIKFSPKCCSGEEDEEEEFEVIDMDVHEIDAPSAIDIKASDYSEEKVDLSAMDIKSRDDEEDGDVIISPVEIQFADNYSDYNSQHGSTKDYDA